MPLGAAMGAAAEPGGADPVTPNDANGSMSEPAVEGGAYAGAAAGAGGGVSANANGSEACRL